MTEQSPSAWLASIAEIFTDLGVGWTVVGALAANEYRATPRFTTDLDTMAEWDDRLVDRLRAAGYEVTVVADHGEPAHLIRCHRGPAAVDILVPVIEYQRTALDRAVGHVLTVEDVIIHKLIAWRARDRDDIRSIIEAGVPLDTEYLGQWIDTWELGERWSAFDQLRGPPLP
jgi:hypothetical protein